MSWQRRNRHIPCSISLGLKKFRERIAARGLFVGPLVPRLFPSEVLKTDQPTGAGAPSTQIDSGHDWDTAARQRAQETATFKALELEPPAWQSVCDVIDLRLWAIKGVFDQDLIEPDQTAAFLRRAEVMVIFVSEECTLSMSPSGVSSDRSAPSIDRHRSIRQFCISQMYRRYCDDDVVVPIAERIASYIERGDLPDGD